MLFNIEKEIYNTIKIILSNIILLLLYLTPIS
jgi:hypothetical protein